MENMKYRYIYEYEFYRGTSAAETARRINNVYGAGVAKENTVRFWSQRFRSGNLDLQNQPRGRSETKVENEELKAIVEADPSQSTSEIDAGFGVSDKTVLIHLNDFNRMITCDEKWILYDNRKRSVWWRAGVVYYSFLKSGQTITADIFCQQMQTMKEELAELL
ncbi:hypothetical protein ABMA28_015818 [Loxostege sticticalis]|uniref:Mos1 transposase HTH domain-containing protein n=1 Tax=Loxostege sticticalis TaxID=481309 RepID=A0ABD0TBE3_LOXSC